MNPESTNPGNSTNSNEHNQRQMDQGVREMISALTHRLTALQQVHNNKPGTNHKDHNHEDDEGVHIITLAGSNTGATLKGELEDKTSPHRMVSQQEDEDGLSTYVNSNFQAINNSIMIGGSYHANDPGVRVEIIDFVDHDGDEKKSEKHEKKGKRKGKETASKSDQNYQHSD